MTADYVDLRGTTASDLTINGGDLASYYLNVGHTAGETGTVTVNSGAFTAEWVNVGRFGTGTLIMNGGTFTGTGGIWVASQVGSEPGHIQLNDGVINAGSVGFYMAGGGATATMDVEAGTLIVDGDFESIIQGFIDNDWITAYGGAGTLLLDYGLTNPGQTTLSAAIAETLIWNNLADGDWGYTDPNDPFYSNWLSGGNPTTEIPGAGTNVILDASNATTVHVEAAHAALNLTVDGGDIVIDDNQSLSVVRDADFATDTSLWIGTDATFSTGNANFAAGTVLSIGDDATFSTADGGQIASLFTVADASLSTGGPLEVTSFTAADDAGGTFTKQGAGQLTAESFTADPATILRIEAGTLQLTGVDPLDGAGDVQLAGGTLSVIPVLGPEVNMTATTITVSAVSELKASDFAVAFGPLVMEQGGAITTSGSAPSISFTGTSVALGTTGAIGFDPQIPTDFGTIDVNNQDVTLTKVGTSTWILDAPVSNPGASAEWAVQGGTLQLEATATLGDMPVTISEGTLSAADSASLGVSSINLDGGTLAVSAAPAAGPDLITNGGFEVNGGSRWADADGWTKDGGALGVWDGYYLGESYGGTHSGQWRYAQGNGTDDGLGGVYQTLAAPLQAGRSYTLSYWGVPWAVGDADEVRVGVYSGVGSLNDTANWTSLTLDSLDVASVTPFDWQRFSHVFTATGAEDTVYFGVGLADSPFGAEIDDVSLTVGSGSSFSMTGNAISVTADSTIWPDADTADFGPLTFDADGILTTVGAASVSFLSTTVSSPQVGFNTHSDTNPGPITANGNTIVKTGSADLIVDSVGGDVTGATIDVQQGRLVAYHGSDPLNGATVSLGGGELLLSAKPEAVSPVTYNTTLSAATDGTVTAGPGKAGHPGPMEVVVDGPDPLLVTALSSLTVQSEGDYTLTLADALSGDGNVLVAGGSVNAAGGGQIGTLQLQGGWLGLDADLTADTVELLGGTADTGVSQLLVTNQFKTDPVTSLSIESGTMAISGSDLGNEAAPRTITLDGGTLSLSGQDLPGGDELITNGNFEDNDGVNMGDAAGWIKDGETFGIYTAALEYGGSHSGEWRYSPVWNVDTTVGVYQTLAEDQKLEAGKAYGRSVSTWESLKCQYIGVTLWEY